MSLLNGLREAMINPLFDAVNEADVDAEFEFEMALEAAIDKQIELSEEDYAAILDDDNPDNVAADISTKDESISKIANDAIDDEDISLESMLDELLASEVDQNKSPSMDPESIESCNAKSVATEMDDDDEEHDETEDDEDSDEVVSLDSLLKSIFEI